MVRVTQGLMQAAGAGYLPFAVGDGGEDSSAAMMCRRLSKQR